MLLGFVVKICNPFVLGLRYQEFSVPSLKDIVDVDKEEMWLCSVRTVKHLITTKLCCPKCKHLFVSIGWGKMIIFRTHFCSGYTMSFISLNQF